MTKRLFRSRNLISIALIVLLMVVAGAFAAANIVPETGAGDGTGTISGYTVSAVDYTLGATSPYYVTGVTFDIIPTAGASAPDTVYAELDGNSILCTAGVSPSFSCDFSAFNVTAAAASSLRVVAAQ